MKNKSPSYSIYYDCESEIVSLSGKLHLIQREKAFHEILSWFDLIIDKEPPRVLLDVSGLDYLNSMGISMIAKFVIRARDKKTIHVVVKASKEIIWQGKSLVNLKRIMPSIDFIYDNIT
ncbi:MAG: STAS domain-containing protein [Synechococcus sp.]